MIDAEQQAERDVLAALEKAVRKNENKKARVIDPLAVATELGEVNLGDYEPETENDAQPATPKQLQILTSNGIDASKVKMRGHASELITRIVGRHTSGLATIRQMHFLSKLGIDASLMKKEAASELMDAKMKEWAARAAAKKSQPEIMEVDGL